MTTLQSLRFYVRLYVTAFKARSEYRVDFAVGVITALAMQAAALAFYWMIFSHAPALGGWRPVEVLFLFGTTAMILGLSEATFNGIWWLPWYLIGGEFDRVLVYPLRSLLFVLLSRPELHSLGNFFTGAITVGVAWSLAPPPAVAYVLLPLWVVSGVIIYTSALVVVACLSFRVLGPWSLHMMAVHHLLNSARYPASIYPRWLQVLTVLVLPFGAAIFVPGSFIRGEIPLLLAIAAPPGAALISTLAALGIWELSVRSYQSTGS